MVAYLLGSITTMVDDSTWGRLETYWGKKSPMTATALAAELGISYQAARKVKLGGGIALETAQIFAKSRGNLNPAWLVSGVGNHRIPTSTAPLDESPSVGKPADMLAPTIQQALPVFLDAFVASKWQDQAYALIGVFMKRDSESMRQTLLELLTKSDADGDDIANKDDVA